MEAERTCRAGQPQTKRELVGLILQAEVELERLQFENVDDKTRLKRFQKLIAVRAELTEKIKTAPE
jgi:hypothetical protein